MNRLLHVPAIALIFVMAFPLHAHRAVSAVKGPKERVPSWWNVVPKSKSASFVCGKAQSADKQIAIDKAAATARGEVAGSVEARWRSLIGAIREENNQLPAPPAYDSSAVLHGTRIAKQAAYRTKKIWTGFVLLEVPVRLVNDALLERLHSMPGWYEAVKDTRAVQRLKSDHH